MNQGLQIGVDVRYWDVGRFFQAEHVIDHDLICEVSNSLSIGLVHIWFHMGGGYIWDVFLAIDLRDIYGFTVLPPHMRGADSSPAIAGFATVNIPR